MVSPLPEHLAGLRAAWGLLDVEPGKQERLSATFGEHLEPVDEVDVRYTRRAGPRRPLDDLVAMGPNAFHRGHDGTHGRSDQRRTRRRGGVAVRRQLLAAARA